MGSRTRIPTPLGQRFKRARVGALPFIVWAGGIALSAQLWLAGPRTPTFYGLAQPQVISISSGVNGRVNRILVDLYQDVGVGDLLAVIDDSELVSRIATARAELDQLSAELSAQRAGLEAAQQDGLRDMALRLGLNNSALTLEYPAELRAFHANETDLDLAILGTRLDLTTSELEADRIEVRLRRAKMLAKDKVGTFAEVEDLELRLKQEQTRIERLRLLEAGQVAKLESSRNRRLELESSFTRPTDPDQGDRDFESQLSGFRAAIVVQQKRIEELDQLRAAHILRAPSAGRVAERLASEGQYVVAGAPLLLLGSAESVRVNVWVSESASSGLAVGDHVLVRRQSDAMGRRSEGGNRSSVAGECVVQSLSPHVEELPQRLWRDPRIAEFGRACMVTSSAALRLVPGERVSVDPIEKDSVSAPPALSLRSHSAGSSSFGSGR